MYSETIWEQGCITLITVFTILSWSIKKNYHGRERMRMENQWHLSKIYIYCTNFKWIYLSQIIIEEKQQGKTIHILFYKLWAGK